MFEPDNQHSSTAAGGVTSPVSGPAAQAAAQGFHPFPGAAADLSHQVHAFVREPYSDGCSVPGCGLGEDAGVHRLGTVRP